MENSKINRRKIAQIPAKAQRKNVTSYKHLCQQKVKHTHGNKWQIVQSTPHGLD